VHAHLPGQCWAFFEAVDAGAPRGPTAAATPAVACCAPPPRRRPALALVGASCWPWGSSSSRSCTPSTPSSRAWPSSCPGSFSSSGSGSSACFTPGRLRNGRVLHRWRLRLPWRFHGAPRWRCLHDLACSHSRGRCGEPSMLDARSSATARLSASPSTRTRTSHAVPRCTQRSSRERLPRRRRALRARDILSRQRHAGVGGCVLLPDGLFFVTLVRALYLLFPGLAVAVPRVLRCKRRSSRERALRRCRICCC